MEIVKHLSIHSSKKSKIISSFGNKFKLAAEEAKVRYSCESFESSLIEIYQNDFMTFIEALTD